MGQVGSAQRRALFALADTEEGIGEVPLMSAPGLINRGLVKSHGRASASPRAGYLCEMTDAGWKFLAELARGPGEGDRDRLFREVA